MYFHRFLMELSRRITGVCRLFVSGPLVNALILRPALLIRAYDRDGTYGDIHAGHRDIFHPAVVASAFRSERGGVYEGRHDCGCDISSLIRACTGRALHFFWQAMYRFIAFFPFAVFFCAMSQLLWMLWRQVGEATFLNLPPRFALLVFC